MTGNITPSIGSGVNSSGSAPGSGPGTPSTALLPSGKENSNSNSHGSRRTHTIMSPEEASAGKRSYWSELELTGEIINFHNVPLK